MVANPQEADGVCSSPFSRNTLQRKFTPELKQHGAAQSLCALLVTDVSSCFTKLLEI